MHHLDYLKNHLEKVSCLLEKYAIFCFKQLEAATPKTAAIQKLTYNLTYNPGQ